MQTASLHATCYQLRRSVIEVLEEHREHRIYKSESGNIGVGGPHLPIKDWRGQNVKQARKLIDWLCDQEAIELHPANPQFKPQHPLLIRKWDEDTYRASDMRIFRKTDDGFECAHGNLSYTVAPGK